MLDLSQRWPLGLSRKTWWLYALGFLVVMVAVVAFDGPGSQWARNWPTPVVDFFGSITHYGLSDWILIPSGSLCLISALLYVVVPGKLRKLLALQLAQLFGFIFVGVGLPGLASNLLKRAIGRGRPGMFDDARLFGLRSFFNDWTYQSFPSGHATTAFALAFVIGFLADRWFPFALLFALAIGVSRVAIGAHYPSDVVAGAVVGTLVAYLVRYLFSLRRWLFEIDKTGAMRVRPLSPVRRMTELRRRRAQATAAR